MSGIAQIVMNIHGHPRSIRSDTIDDLYWKINKQAANLIWHKPKNKNVLNGTEKVKKNKMKKQTVVEETRGLREKQNRNGTTITETRKKTETKKNP